jgi:integrase
MPISESHPLGRQAALRAVELDESLAEAHRSLAAITADYYWDWQEVERHYKRAIALDPNDVTTLSFYSFYLAYTGRPIEALPIAEARTIDLHWHDLRHEVACRWLAKGLDLRAIQLLLGHADLKTTQRYLNVTDEELRKTMAEKLWNRGSAR